MLGRRIPALAVAFLAAVIASAPGTAATSFTSCCLYTAAQRFRAAAASGKKGYVSPCQLAASGTTLRHFAGLLHAQAQLPTL